MPVDSPIRPSRICSVPTKLWPRRRASVGGVDEDREVRKWAGGGFCFYAPRNAAACRTQPAVLAADRARIGADTASSLGGRVVGGARGVRGTQPKARAHTHKRVRPRRPAEAGAACSPPARRHARLRPTTRSHGRNARARAGWNAEPRRGGREGLTRRTQLKTARPLARESAAPVPAGLAQVFHPSPAPAAHACRERAAVGGGNAGAQTRGEERGTTAPPAAGFRVRGSRFVPKLRHRPPAFSAPDTRSRTFLGQHDDFDGFLWKETGRARAT